MGGRGEGGFVLPTRSKALARMDEGVSLISTYQPLGLGRPSEVCGTFLGKNFFRFTRSTASLVGRSLSRQSLPLPLLPCPTAPYRSRAGTRIAHWPTVSSVGPVLSSTSIPTPFLGLLSPGDLTREVLHLDIWKPRSNFK